jgi:hypothetical protein
MKEITKNWCWTGVRFLIIIPLFVAFMIWGLPVVVKALAPKCLCKTQFVESCKCSSEVFFKMPDKEFMKGNGN